MMVKILLFCSLAFALMSLSLQQLLAESSNAEVEGLLREAQKSRQALRSGHFVAEGMSSVVVNEKYPELKPIKIEVWFKDDIWRWRYSVLRYAGDQDVQRSKGGLPEPSSNELSNGGAEEAAINDNILVYRDILSCQDGIFSKSKLDITKVDEASAKELVSWFDVRALGFGGSVEYAQRLELDSLIDGYISNRFKKVISSSEGVKTLTIGPYHPQRDDFFEIRFDVSKDLVPLSGSFYAGKDRKTTLDFALSWINVNSVWVPSSYRLVRQTDEGDQQIAWKFQWLSVNEILDSSVFDFNEYSKGSVFLTERSGDKSNVLKLPLSDKKRSGWLSFSIGGLILVTLVSLVIWFMRRSKSR